MKAQRIGYYVTTGLVALVFLSGGIADLVAVPSVVEGMAHLGYPPYFVTLLGAWKVLGALAIVAPRSPRLKEWAYAGMFFDLTGAFVSHAASGDPLDKLIVPLVLVGVLVASWALRPASRKLAVELVHEQPALGSPALSH